MNPSRVRPIGFGLALLLLGVAVPGRSAPAGDRVVLTLAAGEPEYVAAPGGGVVPVVPGFGLSSRPGEPGLPVRILMVAIPDGVEPRLVVGARAARSIADLDIAPVPTPAGRDAEAAERLPGDPRGQAFGRMEPRRDAGVYGRDGWIPEEPVRLGRVGWMRDQRFVEVIYAPIQYNPARREARLFRDIEAEVRFEAGALETGRSGAWRPDPHFESDYAAAFVNYEQGKSWRSRGHAKRSEVEGGIVDATSPGLAAPAAGAAASGLAEPAPDSFVAAVTTGPRYKLSVTQQGIYRLDQTWLAGNAPDVLATDPRTWSVVVDGVEIPIGVRNAAGDDGESDGVFNPGDVLEFHGGPKLEPPTVLDYHDGNIADVFLANDFTDTQVYWLAAGGNPGSHRRMAVAQGAPVGGYPQAADFEDTAAFNDNNIYIPYGGGDPFASLPSLLAGGPAAQRDIAMPLPGLAAAGPAATVSVVLRGGTSLTVDPDHRTKIWVNADTVNQTDFTWDGEGDRQQSLPVPQTSLSNPVTVHLQAPGLAGVGVDRQYIDTLAITYRRLFSAVGGALVFRYPNQNARFQVSGLGDAAPVICEISRPIAGNGEPEAIRIAGAAPGGAPTTWTFEVGQDLTPGAPAVRTFIAAGTFKLPTAVQPAQPAALHEPGQSADYLVIAARDAVDASPGGALANLLAHRLATQGLTSKVVFIDQVYDEFSGGRRDPGAVRAFLAWAYANWRGPAGTDDPPAYVLLVGDASLDYKDTLHFGGWIDQVTTPILLQISSIIGYYSSDNWMASFLGPDEIPDIHLGRITTRTAALSAQVFDKIRLFETAPPAGTWKGRGVLAASDAKQAGEELLFDGLNEEIRQTYYTAAPMTTPAPPLYYTQPPWNSNDAVSFHDALRDEIQAGAGLMTFVGHGSFDDWGLDTLFTADDAAALTNGLRLPFMINLNCLSGGFHFLVSSGSIGERFVNNPDGGAIAAFVPAGLSTAWIGMVIADELLPPLLGPVRDRRMGPASLAARTTLWTRNSIVDAQSYTFLGDPASLIGVPAPEPPSALSATAGNGQVALAWTPPAVPSASVRVYRAAGNPAGTYAQVACAPSGPASCTDTTVINQTRYYYYVVSADAEGFEGSHSNLNADCDNGPGCVTALPVNPNPPGVPTGLAVVDPGTGGRLVVSWNPPPEADIKRHTVRFGTTSGDYGFSVNVPAPGNSVSLQGLQDGWRYYVTVTAVNTGDLESSPAPEVSGVPHLVQGIAPPRAIADLTIARSGANLVLSWSRPTLDIYGRDTTVVGYRVYRGATPGFMVTGAVPLTVINDGAVTTYTHAGGATAPGDSYYVVTAFDAAGLTSGGGRDLPNGVGALDVTFLAPSTVQLTWPAVTTDVQGFATIVDHYQIHVTAQPVGRSDLGPATLFMDDVTTIPLSFGLAPSPRFISVLAVDNRGNLSPF